jgi:hypothetical protein
MVRGPVSLLIHALNALCLTQQVIATSRIWSSAYAVPGTDATYDYVSEYTLFVY